MTGLAAAQGALQRVLQHLVEAAPVAWRGDPVFRGATVGAGVTLALLMLRLVGPHAPELEPATLRGIPPAAVSGLAVPRGAPSPAQALPAEMPRIAPGHPLSDVTVVPTPNGDRFGTFTPGKHP